MSALAIAEVKLPKPPGIFRRFLADHPKVVDIFIVVCYFIGVGIGTMLDVIFALGGEALVQQANITVSELTPQDRVFPVYLSWPYWPIAVVRVLAVAAALLYRRKWPLLGLIVVTFATFGYHGTQSGATSVALCFLLYAVPVYRSVAAGWVGFGIVCAATFVQGLWPTLFVPTGLVQSSSAIVEDGSIDFWGALVAACIWYLAIILIGINLGNRRRYLQAIIDRAHQLARERDQRAQLAVAEERSRIAREMHDIVAHSVSVMIALSEGAARTVTVAPEASVDAMERSAEAGRMALTEMRRLLGALNEPAEQAAMAPQPTVDELPMLVEGFRDAGVEVELSIVGQAAQDRGQDLALYRVAQEGLTNVLRYAGPGSRARVSIVRDAQGSEIEVRDFGAGSGAGMRRDEAAANPLLGLGSGRGLAGLAERVRVFGGQFEAGPMPSSAGGGWRLWARLPVNEAEQKLRDSTAPGETAQNVNRTGNHHE